MGNCLGSGDGAFSKERSAFDRVTSRTSKDDDCLLYQLADYQRGGDLVKFFTKEGARATEELLKEQIPLLLYNKGEGRIVTRADYLKWKYRGKKHVGVPVDEPVPDWKDHRACWNFEYRGSLGESLLHVLIVCNSSIHSKLAKMLLLAFRNLAVDVVEGGEFRGASALHLAIAYNNSEIIKLLVESGAAIDQRAVGTFFLPRDQQRARPAQKTDYEGLAYFGEYPLAWAACCNNESAYNLLVDRGADPNAQDSFGNMVLHMVVVRDKLEMYGYALRHPRLPAKMGIVNKAGYTPLSLSCHLGRATIFREMLELTAKEYWRYSNITCSAYPLNALDTILPDGRANLNSALMIILNGTKEEHLDMLEGGIIQRLLEEKWKTFAQLQFLKRLIILFIHLVLLSGAVYTRPGQDRPLMMDKEDMEAVDYARFFFEISTCISCLGYLLIAQSSEIKNIGFRAFLSQLSHNPAKAIFVISNFLTLACVPCRLLNNREMEEAILIFSVPSAWFFLMFFAGAIRLTGPFVTMIYSMITGDMLTFAIIYAVMLLAFSQAFYFLHRGHPDKPVVFNTYFTTWMGLFQWTLGDYNYTALGETIYPGLTKIVFVIFMIMVPILLLNMLIAMMGNTYAQVIERSEKEWVKQWAKIVIALERAVNQKHAKEYLVSYSIKISDGTDGSDGSPPQEEIRGVMVIKSKNKTRARQRKGALNNWKHVGRVTIKYLKKRGITGEMLRQQIWDPKTPSTSSINASPCMTPIPPCVPSNTTAAMLLMDSFNDTPVNGPRAGTTVQPQPTSDKLLDNAFAVNSAFNDLSGFKPNNSSVCVHLGYMPLPDPEMINAAIINKLALSPGFIEDVFEATYTPPMAYDPTLYNSGPAPVLPPLPNMPISRSVPSFTDHVDNSANLSDLENEIIAQTLLKGVPPILLPRPSIVTPPQQPPPPIPSPVETQPPTAAVVEPAPPSQPAATSCISAKDALPPHFRPKVLDSPTPSIDIADFVHPSPSERRRQSSPGVMQRQKSKAVDKSDAMFVRPPLVEEQPMEQTPVEYPPPIIDEKKERPLADQKKDSFKLPPLLPRADTMDDNHLMGGYDPYLNGGVKRTSKPRQKRFHRSNVVAPSDPIPTIYRDDRLPPLPDISHETNAFHRVDRYNSVQHSTHLVRSSTIMMDDSEPLDIAVHRRRRQRRHPASHRMNRNPSDNESGGSSSGIDERLTNVSRMHPKRPPVPASSSSQQNTSRDSNKILPDIQPPPQDEPQPAVRSPSPPLKPSEPLVFSVSKDLDMDRQESRDSISPRRQLHEKLSPRRGGVKKSRVAKLTAINAKLKKTRLLVARGKSPVRALSTTSNKIDQVKQDLFHEASAPSVTNLSNLLDDSAGVMADDADI